MTAAINRFLALYSSLRTTCVRDVASEDSISGYKGTKNEDFLLDSLRALRDLVVNTLHLAIT